ncbi:hypothetical protein [Pseudomonas gessardii]|uniref:hypothetical protein n=1 Tax=Pseudomonas gessardii TaxID=78544 RepID=UPI0018D98CCF|nr:hypothetical protein [Pseudomonas gessardii]MBH3424860.1 hypothetical protein [Pseudomonas gessardii]
MTQWAAQTVSSVWARLGELGALQTPSRRSEFGIESVTLDRVKVVVGDSTLVISKAAFGAVLDYLHVNHHHAGNPCVIKSDNDPEKAGPLCNVSRKRPTGTYGPRNITYVLPILERLGVVTISAKLPTAVWLTAVTAHEPSPRRGEKMPVGSLSPVQQAFAEHLATLWSGGPGSFEHRYSITRYRAWKPWKERTQSQSKDWWCVSLAQAAEHYSWPESKAPDDFASIALRLRAALAANDCVAARTACLEIFKWGGVAKKPDDASLQWVEAQAVEQTLCRSILRAVELLLPTSDKSLTAFDGTNLLMNSAMTKVYAAAAPDGIIIYDGRVGAALGLLARKWLDGLGQGVVPPDLAFRWGPNQKTSKNKVETRNPSQAGFKFVCLYTKSIAKQPHQAEIWAGLIRTTSRILQEVIGMLNAQGQGATLLSLERALFMVGFDVRYPLVTDSPMAR